MILLQCNIILSTQTGPDLTSAFATNWGQYAVKSPFANLGQPSFHFHKHFIYGSPLTNDSMSGNCCVYKIQILSYDFVFFTYYKYNYIFVKLVTIRTDRITNYPLLYFIKYILQRKIFRIKDKVSISCQEEILCLISCSRVH